MDTLKTGSFTFETVSDKNIQYKVKKYIMDDGRTICIIQDDEDKNDYKF